MHRRSCASSGRRCDAARRGPDGAADRAARGRVALRSAVGPQAATIDFARGNVHIAHGVARDADVVIRADLEHDGAPRGAEAQGHRRRPSSPLRVRRRQGARRRFAGRLADGRGRPLALGRGRDGRPQRLRVVCTDDGAEHVVGAPGGPGSRSTGRPGRSRGVFNGDDHLGAAVFEGRVQAVADSPR